MTLKELSRLILEMFRTEGGEKYFTASDFIYALFEKNGIDRNKRFTEPSFSVEENISEKIISDGKKLLSGYPIQYYSGTEFFCGEEFFVSENVLIPRKDTETVVENALDIKGVAFADICSGSGCIGISILKKRKDLKCIFFDISEDAISLSVKNAEKIGVSDRCEFYLCDIFSDKAEELIKEKNVSFIVSNPPYIRTDVIPTLEKNVQNEPCLALDGGADGLKFYRRLFDIYEKNHIPCVFEIGYDQKAQLEKECESRNISASFFRDGGGNFRGIKIL